jgi:hypothetical protein
MRSDYLWSKSVPEYRWDDMQVKERIQSFFNDSPPTSATVDELAAKTVSSSVKYLKTLSENISSAVTN